PMASLQFSFKLSDPTSQMRWANEVVSEPGPCKKIARALEEFQAKQLKIDEKFLQKLDQLIGVAKKAEVNDKEIFKKALDDLVNVNSLFTVAVFVGLSLASRNQYSLENRHECDAGPGVAKKLVVFEEEPLDQEKSTA
ncbi:unnamed protein product, partial [Dovyalis caffra]